MQRGPEISIKEKGGCFCDIYAKGIFKIKLIFSSSETCRVVVWIRLNGNKYKSILLIAGAPYISFFLNFFLGRIYC